MPVTRIGLDVAKNVFQAHGVDEHGQVSCANGCGGARQLPFFAYSGPRRRLPTLRSAGGVREN